MDYPSNPIVKLHNGKFTDGNQSEGIDPSLDPASWMNAVTDELLNLITAAGLTPDENILNQVLQAIQIMDLQTISTIKDGIASEGDTLKKLYDLYQSLLNTSPVSKGSVVGGRLSVNVADATANTLDIQPFECIGKNGNLIKTSVVYSKIIDQPIVDGATGGGAKTGITSISANNTFHVYAMLKNDGQVNVGIDTTDATATSLLSVMTNYVDAQLLGSLLYDASGIRGFSQEGNVFTLKNARLGGVILSVTGAGTQVNCYVPTHINAEGMFHFHSAWTGGVLALRLTEWDAGNQYVADTGDYDMRIVPSGGSYCSIHKNIFVGDGEVARFRATAQASAPTATNFNTKGWINHRIGKL